MFVSIASLARTSRSAVNATPSCCGRECQSNDWKRYTRICNKTSSIACQYQSNPNCRAPIKSLSSTHAGIVCPDKKTQKESQPTLVSSKQPRYAPRVQKRKWSSLPVKVGNIGKGNVLEKLISRHFVMT